MTDKVDRRIREALDALELVAHDKVEREGITSPDDVAALMLPKAHGLEQEYLWVLTLNTRNVVINVHEIYHGSLNTSLIRVGELFREAIRDNAAAIIVCHNHPSGDPTPSPEDISVTKAIIEAGNLLDVTVLDHIVLGMPRFTSLKAQNLAF